MQFWYNLQHEPIDMYEANELLSSRDRQVALEKVNGVEVSTVFLVLDHGWGSDRPVLYETMVFEGEVGGEILGMKRWSTREQAIAGHDQIVAEWRDRE